MQWVGLLADAGFESIDILLRDAEKVVPAGVKLDRRPARAPSRVRKMACSKRQGSPILCVVKESRFI
jgi:hypothetical protein